MKVSVRNTHTDVTGRLVISRAWYTLQTLSCLFTTKNRTWCRQSVASCLRVQEKPVERPWRFVKALQSLVGIICRNITRPSSPQTSETEKTRLEMQDWLQMPVIQTSTVIGKNTDGSDITQDVDMLVWWRDVGQACFPRITVMARQFLAIPASSATAERVSIMWSKWGSPSIPLGRGDLDITHPELCD